MHLICGGDREFPSTKSTSKLTLDNGIANNNYLLYKLNFLLQVSILVDLKFAAVKMCDPIRGDILLNNVLLFRKSFQTAIVRRIYNW